MRLRWCCRLKRKTLAVVIFLGLIVITGFTVRMIKNTATPPEREDEGKGTKSAVPGTVGRLRVPASTVNTISSKPPPNDPQKDRSFKAPESSGPVEVLPWDDDPGFAAAKANAGTSVMLGAYCTVLRDPLPGEEYNVHLAADLLTGTVVYPEQIFSQNQRIGPYTEDRGFKSGPTYSGGSLTTTVGGGVCKIASALYNVTAVSNLQVIERHCHDMPVPYVPYGQDATVLYGTYDFKFKNDTRYPVLIWAEDIDNSLYVAFYGKARTADVEWRHEKSEIKKAPVIYRRNPQLPAGTRKIIQEGMDGAAVKSWLVIKGRDGTSTEKYMGLSWYHCMPCITETNE